MLELLTPGELDVEIVHKTIYKGDFNIEYVVIRSPGGKQLYRDDDK